MCLSESDRIIVLPLAKELQTYLHTRAGMYSLSLSLSLSLCYLYSFFYLLGKFECGNDISRNVTVKELRALLSKHVSSTCSLLLHLICMYESSFMYNYCFDIFLAS